LYAVTNVSRIARRHSSHRIGWFVRNSLTRMITSSVASSSK
jgi:hypothetical protein